MTAHTLKKAMEPMVRPPKPSAATYTTVIEEKKNAMIKPTVEMATKKLATAAFKDDEMKRSANATTAVTATKVATPTCTPRNLAHLSPSSETANRGIYCYDDVVEQHEKSHMDVFLHSHTNVEIHNVMFIENYNHLLDTSARGNLEGFAGLLHQQVLQDVASSCSTQCIIQMYPLCLRHAQN
jgi:hypothetical protein